MKAMLSIDFASTKSIMIQQLLLALFVGCFVTLFIGQPFMLVPMIGVMIPLGIIISLVAYDERNGWERYRLTFPLSRRDTVVGRYVFVVLITLGSVIFGLLIHGLLMLLSPVLSALPLREGFLEQLAATDAQTLLAIAFAAFGIDVIIASIIFPLSFRFGMTKAIRWVPLVLVIIFLLVFYLAENSGAAVFTNFYTWLTNPESTAIALLVACAACCVIYVGSVLLSSSLYQRREL